MCIQCADNTYIVFMLHISLPNTLEPGDKISAVVAAAVHDMFIILVLPTRFLQWRQIHLQFYIMILRIREPSCCIIF